jgi:hypothetical protein
MLKGKLNFSSILAIITIAMMMFMLVLVLATPLMDDVVTGWYRYAFVVVVLSYTIIRAGRLILKMKE